MIHFIGMSVGNSNSLDRNYLHKESMLQNLGGIQFDEQSQPIETFQTFFSTEKEENARFNQKE